MAELWIPNLNGNPDVENIFDMMLLFQEQLDSVADPADTASWQEIARLGLRSLAASLNALSFEERQVSVATNMAIVKSIEDAKTSWEVEDVGLRGSLDDIHCMKLGSAAMPAYALGIDVEAFFTIGDPADGDIIMTAAVTPIRHVQYVEQGFAA